MAEEFGPLAVELTSGVAIVTIDHPPTNLVDAAFVLALLAFLDRYEPDDGVRAAVFLSADTDFFLMHGDVEAILAGPSQITPGAAGFAAAAFERAASSRLFTVAAIDGAARGGGAEFAAALDVRIGTSRAVLGQPEAAMGILPGAGGSARLPRLLGRSRALRLILTGADLDAEAALSVGWLDEIVESARLLEVAVALASRVALLPVEVIAAVKRVVDTSMGTLDEALTAERQELSQLLSAGSHVEPMRRFLAAGGQTRAAETADFPGLVDGLLRPDAEASPQ
jgi:enoyl-CoA hydratase/carnithine racemase